MPPDIAETLTNSSILTNQAPAPQPPATQSGAGETQTGTGETQATPGEEEGYKKNESQGLDQLIQGTQGNQGQNTPPPDNQEQPDFGGQTNPD